MSIKGSLKPGRFVNVNGKVLRVKNRINGCKGCCLNTPFTCLSIPPQSRQCDCSLYGIIFVEL